METDVNLLSAEVGVLLSQRKFMLVTAESCTGGALAAAITSIAGSSAWFERGFVSYSNDSKQELLTVSAQTLVTHGAVSEQTAEEMAMGALCNSNAQIALAVTGIAGPDGGSLEKPVGLVYFGWAIQNIVCGSASQIFTGDRNAIRLAAVKFSLEALKKII